MPYTIHDLHRIDRPREKLIKYGPDKLRDEELLAILLRTGRKGENVIELSKRFLLDNKIENLKSISFEELKNFKGIGEAKTCEIIAMVELGKRVLKEKKAVEFMHPRDIWNELPDIRKSKKEHFVIFYLNTRNQEICKEIISIGTLSASLVHPREVFEPAIKNLASGIILVHNHPSGITEPSEEDLIVTEKLCEAGELLDIRILDHVIVTEKSWFSFKERGLI